MVDPNRLRFDGVEAYLGAPLQQGSTTIQFKDPLTHAWNQNIPSFDMSVSGAYMVLGILDINLRLKEIVYLTVYVSGGETGTIVRGAEATTDASHDADRKVVHSATSEDYLDVQEHNTDPVAHDGLVEALAESAINAHIAEHDAQGDPHPGYVLKDSPIMDGPLVIDGDLTVTGDLFIPFGSTLQVAGTLEITGTLIINGTTIFVGPDEPGTPPANYIWIKTVAV